MPDAVPTTAALVAQSARRLDQAGVALDRAALGRLADRIAPAPPPDWSFLQAGPDPDAAIRAILLFASQSGGFTQASPDGRVLSWRRDGSGTLALLDLLRDPAIMAGPQARRARLAGLPFAAARAAAFDAVLECDPRAAADLLRPGLEGRAGWRLADADRLAALLPACFGGDPFRKKAVLALMIAAGLSPERRAGNRLDLPVAADYQIPRVLVAHGVLPPSVLPPAGIVVADVLDPRIMLMRAAAVVAGAALVEAAGRDVAAVDAALSALKAGAAAIPQPLCDTYFF